MRKIFTSDFDGTLYFYKEEVKLPPESVEKIRAYQAAGNLFGLCTGRQVGGLMPFIRGFVEPDFMITASGANIVGRDGAPIFEGSVAPDVADAIIREVRPKGNRMTLDVGGEICVFEKMEFPGKYYVIHGLQDCPPGKIHEVSIHTESLEEAAAMSRHINETYGDRVEAFQNVIEIDIAPKGCSKGHGVEVIRERFSRAETCRIYGIGDSLNDLPLIQAADVSYTFPYAPEELQEKADKVVDNIRIALDDSMADPLEDRSI